MSEHMWLSEQEIKERVLEIFKNQFYLYDKGLKKNKFIYQQLKKLCLNDIEILSPIHPIVSELSFNVAVFHKRKFSDGTWGTKTMQGRFDLESLYSCISEEELDEISLQIIKNYTDRTYNDRLSYWLYDDLTKYTVSQYKEANEVMLYNYPGEVTAEISSFRPVSESKSKRGYYPIAAKIINEDGTNLYLVINVYEDDIKSSFGNSHRFLDFGKMVVFDESRKRYKMKQGFFKYKFVM